MSAFTHSTRHAISNFSYATMGMSLVTDSGGRVDDGLWIGSLTTARSDFIENEGIKTIINLSGVSYESSVKQVRIDIADRFVSLELIDSYLDIFKRIAAAIKDALYDGPVLVHCAMGINRSAAALVYYLITEGVPYMESLRMVTMANDVRGAPTLTNTSFRHLLKTYETVLNIKSSSIIVGSPGYSIPLFDFVLPHQTSPGKSEERL
jgi:hypothetical protein